MSNIKKNKITKAMKFKLTHVSISDLKFNIYKASHKVEKSYLEDDTFRTVFTNENYKCEVKGERLTQIHRDILDIAFLYGIKLLAKSKKQFTLSISYYQILKYLNHKDKNNCDWLRKKLFELQTTKIKIQDKVKNKEYLFSVLSDFTYLNKHKKVALIFSEEYVEYFFSDISINYKNHFKKLMNFKNGTTKAIVRYLFTLSKSLHYELDTLLHYIGINKNEISIQMYRKKKREILEEKEQLEAVGIFIEERDTTGSRAKNFLFSYKKPIDIHIWHPVNAEEELEE